MAKKTMPLGQYSVEKVVKSNLAFELEKLPERKHNYLCKIDSTGKLQVFEKWDHTILIVRYFLITKALIDEVGFYTLDTFNDYELTSVDTEQVERDVAKVLNENWQFFLTESEFVRWLDKHAENLNGKSIEWAINYIKENRP